MPYPVSPQIQSGDRLLLIARCTYRQQLALNSYKYVVEAGSTTEDAVAALTSWMNQAATVYRPLLNSQSTFIDATLRILNGNTLTWGPTLFTQGINVDGSVTGGALPTQVCGIITRRCYRKTNANRGRVYIPFPSVSDCNPDETPTNGYFSRLAALAAVLLPLNNPYVSAGMNSWDPVVAPDSFQTYETLIGADPHLRWATQRRRGDYGTPNVLPT